MVALLGLGAAHIIGSQVGRDRYLSTTASGRRAVHVPLRDRLVCRVPRLLSVEAALDPNEDFNHCQDNLSGELHCKMMVRQHDARRPGIRVVAAARG